MKPWCFELSRMAVVLLLAAVGFSQISCSLVGEVDNLPAMEGLLPITVAETALSQPSTCTNRFATYLLDHLTLVHGPSVRMFETNGSGVAVNDLDDNGRLDLVFANLNGPASILWNEGGLVFRRQPLEDRGTRAVNVVDVDGDGRLDIVFTHVTSALSFWQNQAGVGGLPSFGHEPLPNVFELAHSMAWGDLNGDEALDLVTGSYDAELHLELGDTFLFSAGAGVVYYEQQNGRFMPQRLAQKSEALAIALLDINSDGRRDIVVGNDFDFPDQSWLWTATGWQAAAPFAHTSHSTMSLDWGDMDNNGRYELFATDMNPYETSVQTLAHWLPMMAHMPHRLPNNDPQLMQNVLQVIDDNGRFQNQAASHGIVATGWSWSGKFGDLDNDGFLDLYVVNGMIDSQLFHYLPNTELVEENQAFRNTGDGMFVPMPEWQLGVTASGRGLSLADLDNDGDLDAVINNLQSSALLLENRLCGGSGLEVDLRWLNSPNTYALGAQLRLLTSIGTLVRDVRAGSGYLSGDAARIHFGFPMDTTLHRLEVVWPDNGRSAVDNPTPHTLLTISR